MMNLKNFLFVFRTRITKIRNRIDPYQKIRLLENRFALFERNFYNEIGQTNIVNFQILSMEDTLDYILKNKVSFYRFGDGEFEMVAGKQMSFQDYNQELAKRLRDILCFPLKQGLCGILDVYGSLAQYKGEVRWFFRGVADWSYPVCTQYMNRNCLYGEAYVTRPSIRALTNEARVPIIFEKWKALFNGQDLLIVEGRYSRIGIGNDLLDGAKSIQRIWCPPTNAFANYEEIYTTIKQHAKNKMILLALGATATVLAYDLCKSGFWAIDVGHIDLEYIWMKMGVRKKVPIPGRYVNEVPLGGREMIDIENEDINNHVVAKIGC